MLVAELKANSRKGESPKEKSPGRKEPTLERPSQELPSAIQGAAVAAAPSSTSARSKQAYPYCALPRYVQSLNHIYLGGTQSLRCQGALEVGPGCSGDVLTSPKHGKVTRTLPVM